MKKRLLTFQILVLLLAMQVVASLPSLAQTAERRTSVGINTSVLQYKGDFGSEYWKFDSQQYAPGVALNQYLTRGLDLNLQLFYGQLSGPVTPTARFTTTLLNTNVAFKAKLANGWALKESFPVQPYLLAGGGWTFATRAAEPDSNRFEENHSYLDVMVGAGINLRLGRSVSLFVQSSQHMPMGANLDGSREERTPRWSDRFLQHTVGLTFNLGQLPDADEDGVPDAKDKCPNTSRDVEVDEHGCPLDDDEDGVPNYQDQCPDQAGTAATNGCPDSDNDGVDDTDDVCPEVPGKPELRGCPDTDNDGITDQEDKCPDTPTGADVDGTGCPLAPVPAPATVEDTDNDGVPNTLDRCPDHAGPAANQGCPEVNAATRRRLQEATKLIGFELNKATLLQASYPTLDTLARILTEYPDYSLSIAGHTDSRGPAAFNLRLSRERAAVAGAYLLSRGVAEIRVELRGYGAQHPLATNDTEAGRMQNRRVEFDLYLTGDPSAAQVKYGAEPTVAPVAPAKASKATPAKKGAAAKRPSVKAPAKKRPAGKPTTATPASNATSARKATPKTASPAPAKRK
ncbi:OmpA family protein [Hymenobacter taeanensis]|uniref:OmpA family protein n=1 Tax=Hymenobacter taeanensis TaxID=2735321 RepID=A0A6M6BGR8_9BACT|nr:MULTISPECIES: OmpA family protein [Hymenobacter]QJX47427.1 OmpA family protein [Hymenobacter taeanensis]UOQ83091.1 OmpA family protein [Hymenobacter sp. 5414T-23]